MQPGRKPFQGKGFDLAKENTAYVGSVSSAPDTAKAAFLLYREVARSMSGRQNAKALFRRLFLSKSKTILQSIVKYSAQYSAFGRDTLRTGIDIEREEAHAVADLVKRREQSSITVRAEVYHLTEAFPRLRLPRISSFGHVTTNRFLLLMPDLLFSTSPQGRQASCGTVLHNPTKSGHPLLWPLFCCCVKQPFPTVVLVPPDLRYVGEGKID